MKGVAGVGRGVDRERGGQGCRWSEGRACREREGSWAGRERGGGPGDRRGFIRGSSHTGQ